MLDAEWTKTLSEVGKLLAAFVIALPIAWERERSTRIMGLRTFPIVALASCGYVLVANTFISTSQDANARILQGLVTGIGFIGGGAILKQDDGVQGTATAAAVWSTGAIGAAAAYGRFDIGIAVAVLNFLVLWLFTPMKKIVHDGPDPAQQTENQSEESAESE